MYHYKDILHVTRRIMISDMRILSRANVKMFHGQLNVIKSRVKTSDKHVTNK